MEIEAKIVINSAWSLTCHVLHMMDTYGHMCDDWSSLGQTSEVGGSVLVCVGVLGCFQGPVFRHIQYWPQ